MKLLLSLMRQHNEFTTNAERNKSTRQRCPLSLFSLSSLPLLFLSPLILCPSPSFPPYSLLPFSTLPSPFPPHAVPPPGARSRPYSAVRLGGRGEHIQHWSILTHTCSIFRKTDLPAACTKIKRQTRADNVSVNLLHLWKEGNFRAIEQSPGLKTLVNKSMWAIWTCLFVCLFLVCETNNVVYLLQQIVAHILKDWLESLHCN